MRVLIATTELQDPGAGDYCFTVEGELVTPVVAQCHTPDDCGCSRGFPGLASSRATTTAMVVERPFITSDDLRDVVLDSLARDGWLDLLGDDADEIDEIVDEHVDAIEEICRTFAVGTVVERHGTLIASRTYRAAA
jgi:hypothetical protein